MVLHCSRPAVYEPSDSEGFFRSQRLVAERVGLSSANHRMQETQQIRDFRTTVCNVVYHLCVPLQRASAKPRQGSRIRPLGRNRHMIACIRIRGWMLENTYLWLLGVPVVN